MIRAPSRPLLSPVFRSRTGLPKSGYPQANGSMVRLLIGKLFSLTGLGVAARSYPPGVPECASSTAFTRASNSTTPGLSIFFAMLCTYRSYACTAPA